MKKEREELKRMEKVCGQMRRMQPDAEAKTQAMEEIEGGFAILLPGGNLH